MPVYLVQHGLATPEKQDPEQGLSTEGISDIERIASVAAGYHVKVSRIQHSGKKRAEQTAEIFAAHLKPGEIVARSGLNPNDNILDTARDIENDNTMFVGHLPFLTKLVSYLITGSEDNRIIKFQNGGIVCLDLEAESDDWIIKWTLSPNIK